MQNDLWVVIPCAGSGSRMKSSVPKQYLPFQNSILLDVTLERFLSRKDIKGIVVVVSDKNEFIDKSRFSKDVHIVIGGKERYHSVFNALNFLKGRAKASDLIAVHDAARPCIRQSLLNQLFFRASQSTFGVVLAEPCTQTVKQIDGHGSITQTLDRQSLLLVQTPQVFPFSLLHQALQKVFDLNLNVTDESSAIESLGMQPEFLQSSNENIKITYQQDLALAEFIFQRIIESND